MVSKLFNIVQPHKAVFGVKDSLVVDFKAHPPGMAPDGSRLERSFSTVSYDFVLAPA